MDIVELRSEFSVYIFYDSKERKSLIENYTQGAGYSAKFISSYGELINVMKTEPPHILVFFMSSLDVEIKKFIEDMTSSCRETLLVAIGSDYQKIKHYFLFGLYDFLFESEGYPEQLIWRLDRACEKLYLVYQNEELIESIQKETSDKEAQKIQSLNVKPSDQNLQIESSKDQQTIVETLHKEYNQLMDMISHSPTSESLIDEYLKFLYEKQGVLFRGIFFKYYPSKYTLLALQAIGFSSDHWRGVGLRFESIESLYCEESLLNVNQLEKFKKMMADVFQVRKFFAQSLKVDGFVQGVLVMWLEGLSEAQMQFDFFKFFEIVYQKKFYYEKLIEIDIVDNQTHVLNKKGFDRSLLEEMARARRLKQPVSLIRIKLDKTEEFISKYGKEKFILLLKSIAVILKKTSRVNDVVARLDKYEFAVLLAHTGKKGALIKAERLRLMIHNAEYVVLNMDPKDKVTVSLGISEYPSLARDLEDLLKTSQEAVNQIHSSGGNQVGILPVVGNFNPDFIVKEE